VRVFDTLKCLVLPHQNAFSGPDPKSELTGLPSQTLAGFRERKRERREKRGSEEKWRRKKK